MQQQTTAKFLRELKKKRKKIENHTNRYKKDNFLLCK